MFVAMLRCVSITPLAAPVVPLEYGSTATSFAGSISTTGSGPVDASSSITERYPSAVSQTRISWTSVPSIAAVATGRKSEIVTSNLAFESTNCLCSSSAV